MTEDQIKDIKEVLCEVYHEGTIITLIRTYSKDEIINRTFKKIQRILDETETETEDIQEG
jgi:hypothetical protein